MLLPFLILFFFNHPSADDWGLSQNPKISGFIAAQKNYYYFWTGKYFSNLLMSFNPLYFGSLSGYKVLTMFLMIAFIYVLFTLISSLTSKSLNLKEKFLITSAIFFLYLYSMPSLPQSFYWLTAAVVYQLGIMMIMMFLIIYIKLNDEELSGLNIFLIFIQLILLIGIAGCSEMSMVIGILIIVLIAVSDFLKKRKISFRLILYAVVSGAASYVLISAPGNLVRGSIYPNAHRFFPSLWISFTILSEYLYYWIFYSPLLFVTFLTIPVLSKLTGITEKHYFRFSVNPLTAFLIYTAFLLILFFIPAWSMGGSPVNRTVNIIYFVFLSGWFFNIIVLICYISGKNYFDFRRIPKYFYTFALAIVLLFLFKKNNIRLASADLLRGTAVRYNTELNERYENIMLNPSDSLVVPNLKNTPRSIYIVDIFNDPAAEVNRMYARFFNKKSISLINTDTLQNQK